MLRRYKSILFDMDGTLVDTTGLWLEHIERVLAEEGYRETLQSGKIEEVLTSGKDPIETLLPQIGRDEVERLYEKVRKGFLRDLDRITPNLTRKDLLTVLDGRPAAVVTQTHSYVARKVLETVDLLDLFEGLITCDVVNNLKPHPEPLLKALDLLGEVPAVYVGDTPTDEEAAQRAGLDFLHVRAVRRYVQGAHL